MGRRDKEASPIISDSKVCPARIPASMRIVDPELPQSSAIEGASNCNPTPSISTVMPCVMRHPKVRRHESVLAQFPGSEKFDNDERPSEIAANMA